jgi:hypothetical protein
MPTGIMARRSDSGKAPGKSASRSDPIAAPMAPPMKTTGPKRPPALSLPIKSEVATHFARMMTAKSPAPPRRSPARAWAVLSRAF